MGYSTDFIGQFKVSPPLLNADKEFLTKFSNTRRMARNVGPEYGIEGEFYVGGEDRDTPLSENADGAGSTILNYNVPPKTQPGLWCQWIPTEDGCAIEWSGGEKFYCYVEWIEYLIAKILRPRGYVLNGTVEWQGEDRYDMGAIVIKDNTVEVKQGRIVYD